MGWLEEAMGRYQQMQQGGSPLMQQMQPPQQYLAREGTAGMGTAGMGMGTGLPKQYPGGGEPMATAGMGMDESTGRRIPQPGQMGIPKQQQDMFTPISQQLGGGQQGGFNQQAGRAPVGDFLSRFGGQFPLMDPSKFMSQFAQGQGMPFSGQRPGPMANTRPVYEQPTAGTNLSQFTRPALSTISGMFAARPPER
jgi:hypothetical protein